MIMNGIDRTIDLAGLNIVLLTVAEACEAKAARFASEPKTAKVWLDFASIVERAQKTVILRSPLAYVGGSFDAGAQAEILTAVEAFAKANNIDDEGAVIA
jgi:hypothetical protein